MPVMRDVTKTTPFRRPSSLAEIPLRYALSDSAYLLHCVFRRDATDRTNLRHREPISSDDYRLTGLYTVEKLRKARLCVSQADSLIHMTSLS